MTNVASNAVSARTMMPQAAARSVAAGRGLGEQAPFRWTQRDKQTLPVTVSGSLPAWLQGSLVRTAPAIFEVGDWRAAHWFDGLGLVYGFTIADGVRFAQAPLDCQVAREIQAGDGTTASFGTPMRRTLWQRLRAPVPAVTDNANVNIVPWQGEWLAMTETAHQHVIEGSTLQSRGLYRYDDDLSPSMSMLAHPHFDFTRDAMLNIGLTLGPKNELSLLRQGRGGRRREVEGKLALKRMPYVHDFGLSDRHAVLIAHPYTVNPLRLLFSNRGYIEPFRWQPERGTTLWKLDRATGRFTDYQTEPLFCFHTVNTFEDGDDVVLDFLAFDDPSVVGRVATARLEAEGMPTFLPRLVRARLSPGKRHADLTTLTDTRFEFPNIAYRAQHGRPYRTAWGVSIDAGGAGGLTSEVVRVDLERDAVVRFSEPEVTYGEPVFVPRPGAAREDEGVILTVGSDTQRERSLLAVLDATTLEPLARCEVGLSLPLGFHGNFRAA
jgi:beta,beta-carotene 9',10'-dioxygenase